jgi:protein-S-isoprenylcysteine O-methyltransferase Ste14
MSDTADTANVIIRPPIAWALAVLVALALQWLMPLPFMPASVPAGWVGGAVFAMALALAAWAIATITRAGSNVPTNMPTTTIVDTGPYRFTRNPIYLAMFSWARRSCHCLRQPLAAGGARALHPRYPLWRSGSGGSLP